MKSDWRAAFGLHHGPRNRWPDERTVLRSQLDAALDFGAGFFQYDLRDLTGNMQTTRASINIQNNIPSVLTLLDHEQNVPPDGGLDEYMLADSAVREINRAQFAQIIRFAIR